MIDPDLERRAGMWFGALFERELKVAARTPRTYWGRAIAAAVATAIGLFWLAVGVGATGNPAMVSAQMFHRMAELLAIFCAVEGARSAGDSLHRERREGTLDLLWLTGMGGAGVVRGKLLAHAIRSLGILLAVVPVLGLGLMIGGVVFAEFVRTVLALSSLLVGSLSLGLAVGASVPGKASGVASATLFWMAVWLVAPFVAGGFMQVMGWSWGTNAGWLSPWAPLRFAGQGGAGLGTANYWGSIGLIWAISAGLMAWAGWRLMPGTGSPVPSVPARPRWSSWRRPRKRKPVGDDAAYWLASRLSDGVGPVTVLAGCLYAMVLGVWLYVPEVGFAIGMLGGVSWLVGWMVRVGVASQSCEWLSEARREGAFEMIFSTPLQPSDLLEAHRRAVWRSWRWLIGVVVIGMVCSGVAFVGSLLFTMVGLGMESWGWKLGLGAVGGLTFLVDLAALFWVGSWLALRGRTGGAASVLALLGTQILPLVFFCLPAVFADWVFIWVFRAWLRRDFWRLATEVREGSPGGVALGGARRGGGGSRAPLPPRL